MNRPTWPLQPPVDHGRTVTHFGKPYVWLNAPDAYGRPTGPLQLHPAVLDDRAEAVARQLGLPVEAIRKALNEPIRPLGKMGPR